MARLVWFHIPGTYDLTENIISTNHLPDVTPENPDEPQTLEQRKARALIEKKTAINLLEAFGISVKHYLRAEDGIFYEDLYHLVKFLPAYALPNAMASNADLSELQSQKSRTSSQYQHNSPVRRGRAGSTATTNGPTTTTIATQLQSASLPHLPMPASTPGKHDLLKSVPEVTISGDRGEKIPRSPISPRGPRFSNRFGDESFLLPAHMPPKYGIFDLFPFSLLVHFLTKRVKEIGGKKAARMRAKLRSTVSSHNIPLEISLYLVRYPSSIILSKLTKKLKELVSRRLTDTQVTRARYI
jgi:putative membrane protein